ncbi:aquaporin TIP2-1-like, partial [Thalictrum thalictroides]
KLTADAAVDTFSVAVILISHDDLFSVGALKAYLAEFIATLLFVFAVVESATAFSKLTADAALDPAGLVAIALAHAFALFVGVPWLLTSQVDYRSQVHFLVLKEVFLFVLSQSFLLLLLHKIDLGNNMHLQ